jgi:protein-S-isoprenylcysteine O-methyltransferase Ste14
MYVAGMVILLGHLLWSQAAVLLAYAAFMFLGFHLFVVLYEEPALSRQFGEAYREYCARVPRWLPRLET